MANDNTNDNNNPNEVQPVIDTQDGSLHTFVAVPTNDGKPVEIIPAVDHLPKAEDMASPFTADKSVTNDSLLTDEDRKAADKSGPDTKKKKSNLFKAAKFWSSANVFEQGTIESEFDDGTVDIALGTGRRTRIHLKNGKDDNELPCVELS